jgi:hypothetical protein
MNATQAIVVLITLTLAAVFLALWQRRDRGEMVDDRLPEALHEPLDGRSPPSPVY